MTLAILFWVLLIIWLLFGGWNSLTSKDWKGAGNWAIPLVLLLILGWRVFGAPVQG